MDLANPKVTVPLLYFKFLGNSSILANLGGSWSLWGWGSVRSWQEWLNNTHIHTLWEVSLHQFFPTSMLQIPFSYDLGGAGKELEINCTHLWIEMMADLRAVKKTHVEVFILGGEGIPHIGKAELQLFSEASRKTGQPSETLDTTQAGLPCEHLSCESLSCCWGRGSNPARAQRLS